jgi:hypothetical protein
MAKSYLLISWRNNQYIVESNININENNNVYGNVMASINVSNVIN